MQLNHKQFLSILERSLVEVEVAIGSYELICSYDRFHLCRHNELIKSSDDRKPEVEQLLSAAKFKVQVIKYLCIRSISFIHH